MTSPRTARPLIEEASTTLVDVAAWTQNAIQAMNGLSLHTDPNLSHLRGASVGLQVPLDENAAENGEGITAGQAIRAGYVLRRKTSQRDSMNRRDAILKGREGSRQRRRWENDRLLGNPHAEPPLPRDWEVRPTHPVHTVGYHLAPLWDAHYAKQSAARKEKEQAKKRTEAAPVEVGRVPKELKEKLKRARGAKALLQDLEQEVRSFVQDWEEKERIRAAEDALPDADSDEDEIVFIGRNGQMHDRPPSPRLTAFLEREKLVFDADEDDRNASFARWLVHSIGQYYGLETWSVTVGKPARREAYVGIKEVKPLPFGSGLPRPLWAMV